MTQKRETRAASIELRADGEKRKIAGYAALFDTPADIAGMFREQIAKGAFAAAIERDDVRALFDHDSALVLGRNRAGTLKLEEDDKGLRIEIDPPDTQFARDLMVSMERGDITQMSFGFIATRQEWDDTQTPPLRTVLEVELFDVSVVTYAAYPETSAAVRSLEAFRKEQNFKAASLRIRRSKDLDLLVRGIKRTAS